jgi:hypothetical protein
VQPLLSVGRPAEANILFLYPDKNDSWLVACDVWGSPLQAAAGLAYRDGPIRLDITLDREEGKITCRIDNQAPVVLSVSPFPSIGLPAYVGTNHFGGSWACSDFAGTIRLIERH